MRVTTDDAYKIVNGSLLLCSGRLKKSYGCGPRRNKKGHGTVDQSVLEPAFRQRGLNDYPSSGGNKKVCQIGQGNLYKYCDKI